TARLALESVVDLRRPTNRLAVRHQRRSGLDRRTELAPQAVDDDVNVRITHGGEDRLAGSFLAVDPNAGLLLEHPGQRLAELVEVRLALRLDAHLQCRARECKAWQLQRMRAIRDERVAGLGARQFGDRDDVSRPRLWRVLLVLAE